MTRQPGSGRFQVVRPLWTGSHATAELARDAFRGDRLVTLKTIAPGRLPPRVMARLQREFTIRRRLKHAGIAELLDFEFDDAGACRIVREYVDGTDFVTWCEGRDVSAIADVTVQVLQALAYLHDCGLVHGSIRPSNVVVVGGDRPYARLLDFDPVGDVVSGRDPVDRLHYAAPEVLRAQVPDGRSDLYSLGVLLLYGLQGRLPFEDQNQPAAVVAWHLSPSAERVPKGCRLARTIERLLEVAPERRFSEAPEVVRAIGTEVGRRFRSRVIRESEQLLVTGRFVGRERELRKIEEVARRVFNGSGGRFFLVAGPRGIGKSRLLDEARVLAHISGIRVIAARCGREGCPPLGVLRDVLRQLVTHMGVEHPVVEQHRAVLTTVLPEIFEAVSARSTDADLGAADAWLRVKNGITDFLAGAADVRPLLILLDDLQAMDEPSLAVLRWLSNTFRGGPFMIVASLRDDPVPAGTQPANALLVDEEHEVLRLRPLQPSEIEMMLSSVLALSGTLRELTDLIMRLTGGVPLFIEELIRSLIDGDLTSVLGDATPVRLAGDGDANRVAARALALAVARMRRLGDDAQRLLGMLSAFEGPVPLSELQVVAALEPVAEAAALQSLDAAEVVSIEPRAQGSTISWRSDLFREAARSLVSPEVITGVHDQVVDHLSARNDGSVDHVARVAFHALRGSRRETALKVCIAAARHGLLLHAGGSARPWLERARQMAHETGDQEARREALNLLSEACERAGDLDGARAAYEELRELPAADPDTGVNALLRIGDIESSSGRQQAADRTFSTAGQEAERIGDARLISRVERAAARQLMRRELYRDARDRLDRALSLLGEFATPAELGGILGEIGLADWHLGDLGSARLHQRRSLQCALRARDWVLVTTAHLHLGLVDWKSGRTKAALGRLTRAEALSRRLGHYPLRAAALQNRGAIELELGRLAQAVQTLTQSLAVRRRLDDDPGVVETLAILATAQHRGGRHDVARRLLDDAIARASNRGDVLRATRARVALGRVLLTVGALDAAETLLRSVAQSPGCEGDRATAAGAWLGLHEIARERLHDGNEELDRAVALASGHVARVDAEVALAAARRAVETRRTGDARKHVAAGLRAARALRDTELCIRARWIAGLVRTEADRIVSFNAAVRGAERCGMAELGWRVHRDRGAALLELGRGEAAQLGLRDGMRMLRAIHDALPASQRPAYLSSPGRQALRALFRQSLSTGVGVR